MSEKKSFIILIIICLTFLFTNIFITRIASAFSTDGLVAYYPFNGNANDESGHGNDGIVNGAILTSDRFLNTNSAYSFNGENNYIDAGNDWTLNVTNAITISAWINPSSTRPLADSIVAKWSGESHYESYCLYIYDYHLGGEVTTDNGCVGIHSTDEVIILNEWQHLVITYNSANNEGQLYKNGNLVQIWTASGTINTSSNPLTIGIIIRDALCHAFSGAIDDIHIYNRALSISEILELYNITPNKAPLAITGTSLDGNNMLQLDGTLSIDPDGDSLNYMWQIQGELNQRLGQIVSIADLGVGTYTVTLSVDDCLNSSTDKMLLGIPADAGQQPPNPDQLQQYVLTIKELIISFPETSFSAPNLKAKENRRKSLLNMLDKVFDSIGVEDFQAAIDQLRDILAKSDGLEPPESPPDWIIGNDAQLTSQAISDLLNDLLVSCSECN